MKLWEYVDRYILHNFFYYAKLFYELIFENSTIFRRYNSQIIRNTRKIFRQKLFSRKNYYLIKYLLII